MKKIISFVLCICSVFMPLGSLASEGADMGAQLTIYAIAKNTCNNKFELKASLPSAVAGGTLLMVFYTDGMVTQTERLDVSSKKSYLFTNFTYTKTPDRIRFFLWNEDGLLPLAKSCDMLTESVITKANGQVKNLISDIPDTTDYIRQFLMPDSKPEDIKIASFLDIVDLCAQKVGDENLTTTHLLTSEYCREYFSDELDDIKDILKDDAVESRLKIIYQLVDSECKSVVGDLIGFFDLPINIS